jgi:hypothetical protein
MSTIGRRRTSPTFRSLSTHRRRVVARIALGLVVAAIVTGCGALGAVLQPFPSVPAQACRNVPAQGSPAPAIDWHVAAEIDRPQGSAIVFASASDTLLCFVSRSADGSLGGIWGGSGGRRDAGPSLTLDQIMSTPGARVWDLVTGRVPTGTTTVKVSSANGAEDVAAVGNGYYLAWLRVPAEMVQIDALDASGRVLQRLEVPNGSPVPS